MWAEGAGAVLDDEAGPEPVGGRGADWMPDAIASRSSESVERGLRKSVCD